MKNAVGVAAATYRRRAWPSLLACAFVALFHGMLLVIGSVALRQPQRATPASRAVLLRLVEAAPTAVPQGVVVTSPTRGESLSAPARRTSTAPAGSPRPGDARRALAPAVRPGTAPQAVELAQETTESPAKPASSAGAGLPPLLLETEATRRAIRAIARERPLRELAAGASGEPRPIRSEERLALGIARAGKGDCMKGEFFGGNAGLLSLPFWAIAELQEKCKH